MFKNAKVGDKVWSIIHSWGTITSVNIARELPIRVEFITYIGKAEIDFTIDGKYSEELERPVLFWQEFEIPQKAFKKPLPNLATDTKVIVWLDGKPKFRRYFKRFNEEGKIVTFQSGKTSWTSKAKDEATWDNWELANEK